MEKMGIGEKILIGLLIWFLLGEWLLFLVFAVPFLLPLLPAVAIVGIIRILVKE